MACQTCLNDCCVRPCVEELLCAMDCCGCCHVPILLAPNLDLKAGTILGQRSSDLRFAPFDPLAVDGTQTPRGILQYHVLTDGDGNVVHRYFGYLGLGWTAARSTPTCTSAASSGSRTSSVISPRQPPRTGLD
jgi:hypothetical protein